MTEEVLSKLKSAGLLSDEDFELGFVSTGSYALNKVMGGAYTAGVPIGYITQFCGESSTAKTVFVTETMANAQRLGYYTILIDAENAYNPEFAAKLGIDPKKLIYAAPPTLEECFTIIEKLILEIRELDKDTPIVVGYDSISVSPIKEELDGDEHVQNNMTGARRAVVTGKCLRRLNTFVRDQKVALMVVNQLREKVGVMFGDTMTNAAGGKSLPFYLGIEMRTTAAISDRILDANKQVVGIRGNLRNTKNKISLPFRRTPFELWFDKGLNPYYGLLDSLVLDGLIEHEKGKSWYTLLSTGLKFQKKAFEDLLTQDDNFKEVRELIGINDGE